MLHLPRVDRQDGRPAPGDLRPALRRLHRRLLVPVPDERPAERRAPEDADVTAPVARQLAERPAAGEVAVARLDDAEGGAGHVGEHDVLLLGQLPDVDVTRAEGQRPRHRHLLVTVAVAGDVQVHPGAVGRQHAARDEPQAELRLVTGDEHAVGVRPRPGGRAGPPRRRQRSLGRRRRGRPRAVAGAQPDRTAGARARRRPPGRAMAAGADARQGGAPSTSGAR